MKKIFLSLLVTIIPLSLLANEDFENIGTIPNNKIYKINKSVCGSRLFTQSDMENISLYLECPLPESIATKIPNSFTDFEKREPNFNLLTKYQRVISANDWRERTQKYFNPDHSLDPYVKIIQRLDKFYLQLVENRNLIEIPFSGSNSELGPILDQFYRDRRDLLNDNYDPSRPLAGIKIAIDPGHIGGKWSDFEERHYVVKEPGTGKILGVNKEGDLSVRTALILNNFLKASGAQVFLSRTEGGDFGHPFTLTSLYPESLTIINDLKKEVPFFRENESILLRNQLLLFFSKRRFIFEDWRFRTEAMNSFRPDLMIYIHYNAGGSSPDRQPIMSFVKGHVEKVRVDNPYYRFRLVQDILRGDMFDGAALAYAAMLEMNKSMQLPIFNGVSWRSDIIPLMLQAPADFPSDNTPTPRAMKGVYIWNLGVMKYADAPAMLTEGSFFDHST
ncbi:MAG: hypothetical protein U0T83_08040, partial [Bacteriovoracaceae bacterium]